MFVTFKFRDAVPLCVALLLILATFLLPQYPGTEPEEAVSVFSAEGPVLIIDAGHGGADGGAVARGRHGGEFNKPGHSAKA